MHRSRFKAHLLNFPMATFLLEVGTEELPASFVGSAIAQWQTRIPQALAELGLTVQQVQVYGTPRRLAIVISGLPLQQPDRLEEVKGPPAKAAFQDGQPTPVAQGFARKQGVPLEALEIRATPKGEFVFVEKTIQGAPIAQILTEQIPQWIFGLEGKRFMRWGNGDLRFPRPIRWLVALLDETVLPLCLENGDEVVKSDRLSQGHRVLHPAPLTIVHAQDYGTTLKSGFVLVDPAERRSQIHQQTEEVARQAGGEAQIPDDLLEEVTHLVEWPTAVVGQFDAEFLNLPPEVITTVMISHQRYFPIRKSGVEDEPTAIRSQNHLLPCFVTISNGDPAKSAVIAAGNGRVIRARLADGQFFYQADCRQPLEAYLPKLETVTFEESLGSVAAKVERLSQIADHVATQLQVSEADRSLIQRAARLCKADLVTQMVYEFPELQGVMGQKYGIVHGEPEAVYNALFEYYLPKGAGDRLPTALVSQVVGLADRLDTLVSIFGLGLLPTGSSDPYALRRAANAVVNLIWAGQLSLNLGEILDQAIAHFCQTIAPKLDRPGSAESLRSQLQEFFLQRIRTLLQEEQGIDYDLVNAVLGDGDVAYGERAIANLLDVGDRARFLQTIRQNGQLDQIYETVNRSTRLAAQGTLSMEPLDPVGWVKPEQFQQPTEQAFYEALIALLPQTQAAQATRDYGLLVTGLRQIAPTVSTFFDGDQSVLVMDPDLEIRQNRLNLLGLLRNHARVLADFGAIVKS
jgi:glycyl-tRNA synthetase beta chain